MPLRPCHTCAYFLCAQNSRQRDTVAKLLEFGASLTVRNNAGKTATDLACDGTKNVEICKLLTSGTRTQTHDEL